MLGSMFVGLLVGFLAGAMTNRGERMGCFGKMFLGWIGAFLGHLLFGTWGPVLSGTAIIPVILGAMIVLAIFWRRGS
ncbi:GlsB/YeaQ/YmgE family stress response membrane protein [Streptococcus pneumoniae]|uniref:GlsB/YeaQ/YmgE family stress response membrane protein n=1 Tax=Streptococcus pneumoniae TaxID=1313 RepID=UPI00076549DB|nr:GlsB/YeaQ/YmgE family stress response membrane protein [Streptococcus pneumoniae]CVW41122.1 integral membrane protein [Streptococcus pneumoniae]CWD46061.1 integral membrane protein [Streptococcus pneumoniae]HET0327613.1 GlsB/YeaQ/YmgE family stress response membrane protein [Streptococcus pneumoniae]